ncbi:MAG: 4Fe-4S binding protein, partial [Spirochaetes bacterium]|nr:4Fe-4S binding protein [Spirochaetota bacterium]
RRGKLAQHSVMSPRIDKERCTACGTCIKWCPKDAVSLVEKKADIDGARCIGCGECLAVCREGAVMFDWGRESRVLQEMMAEYVKGVSTLLEGRIFFFNFLLDITKNCDCMNGGPRVSNDIGIAASADIVAVEKASYDIFHRENKKPIQALTYPRVNPLLQVEHAAHLGLGFLEYELVSL